MRKVKSSKDEREEETRCSRRLYEFCDEPTTMRRKESDVEIQGPSSPLCSHLRLFGACLCVCAVKWMSEWPVRRRRSAKGLAAPERKNKG